VATLARLTWSGLVTEIIQAAGGYNYSGFSGRVQNWLYETYLDIALTIHHPELDVRTDGTLLQGQNTAPLTDDCFIVIGVALLDQNANVQSFLPATHFNNVIGAFDQVPNKVPTLVARFGKSLYFNRPAPTPTGLIYRIFYYRQPSPPDYSILTYPETNWLWDAHLQEGTLARIKGRIWRPDLAGTDAQTLAAWVGQQTQSMMAQNPIITVSDMPRANSTLGGAQG